MKSYKGLAIFTWAIIIALVVSGCGGQSSGSKVYHVGILSGSDSFAALADGFKAKMTELGYIEGQNIVYDLQKLNNDRDGEKRIVKKFVDDKVDLIFVFPTDPALAAKAATAGTGIPVVFGHAGLEGSGLVNSLREPGGNMSGTRFPGPDLLVRRFEILIQVAPQIKRLYVPYDKNYPLVPPVLDALRPVASSAGVTLVEVPAATLEEVKSDLQARDNSEDIGIDGILLLPELMMSSPDGWGTISKFAAEHSLPLVGSPDASVKTGGLFSYNVNPVESGQLAATVADKVFKGLAIGTIPVLTPQAYLRFNFKVAQALGLTIPEGLLKQAVEIIH